MGDRAETVATEKKSRTSYTLEKKLQRIATANRLNNIDRAAELEGVPRSCLVKWMAEETKFKEASRPLKLQELDTCLAEWVKERRAQKQKVTYRLITHEAALRLKKIPSGATQMKELRKAQNFAFVCAADETAISMDCNEV
ncbi:hypothetical protein AAVH_10764 [Aphelenchoides avenae]|nr:hypothetical protein AAVH_10764 [Aphelenchus avenae]